jgi:hypothetical protein
MRYYILDVPMRGYYILSGACVESPTVTPEFFLRMDCLGILQSWGHFARRCANHYLPSTPFHRCERSVPPHGFHRFHQASYEVPARLLQSCDFLLRWWMRLLEVLEASLAPATLRRPREQASLKGSTSGWVHSGATMRLAVRLCPSYAYYTCYT